MTRVVIVEDEHLAAQKLTRQLKNIEPDLEIVCILDTVEKSVEFLSKSSVDLIFLDIHLGDDLSFSIFEKIKIKTPIIFTTAYDQYAIKAFELNSIDYLLKPVNKTDLKDAMEKFYERRSTQVQPNYEDLIKSLNLDNNNSYQSRFMVYKGDKVKSIETQEIAYFFAEGKYVYLVDENGSEYLVDYTLDKLKEKLSPQKFFRINRQFIIQIDAIGDMTIYTKGRLKIMLRPESKKEAIVSIERASEFKEWLNQ